MYYISEPGPRCSGSNTFTPNSWCTADAGWVDLKQLWLWAGNIWYFLPMKLMKRSENPQRIFWLLFSVCLHIGSQWGCKSLKRAKKKKKYNPESREDRALCKFCITNKSGQVWILPQVNKVTASRLGMKGDILNVFGKVQSFLRTADHCYFYRRKQLTSLITPL